MLTKAECKPDASMSRELSLSALCQAGLAESLKDLDVGTEGASAEHRLCLKASAAAAIVPPIQPSTPIDQLQRPLVSSPAVAGAHAKASAADGVKGTGSEWQPDAFSRSGNRHAAITGTSNGVMPAADSIDASKPGMQTVLRPSAPSKGPAVGVVACAEASEVAHHAQIVEAEVKYLAGNTTPAISLHMISLWLNAGEF